MPTDSLETILEFIQENPSLRPASKRFTEEQVTSAPFIEALTQKYETGLRPRSLGALATDPDPALLVALSYGFGADSEELDEIIEWHRRCMAAENLIGYLLELYIYSEIRDDDWIWCPGSVVKSVDFIRKRTDGSAAWEALQIKNRSNSENSSSAAVRQGTLIKKWFRIDARQRGNHEPTHWHEFPTENSTLSEDRFQEFIRNYFDAKTS